MKKRVKWVLFAVIAAVCVLGYGITLLKPKAVEAETVVPGDLTRSVTVEGTLLPCESLVINAADSGVVSEVFCRQGMEMSKGQVLAKLSADPAISRKLQSEQLAQQLAAAKQEYDRLYGADGAAALELKTAEEAYRLAQKNYDNQRQLFAEGYASQIELDQEKNRLNLAEQACQQAKNQASETSRQYHLDQIEAYSRQLALLDGGSAAGDVVMPFDGVVWEVYAENGSFMQANQPLCKVYRPDEMKLEAAVLSEDGAGLTVGMTAQIRYLDGTESEAEITFLSNVAEQMVSTIGMEENRCLVELRPAKLPEHAGAGQCADVSFTIVRGENLLTVPASAILAAEDGNAVYVIRGGKAVCVPVETGIRESGRIEIISGIAEGDQVIADPYEEKVSEGDRVKGQ